MKNLFVFLFVALMSQTVAFAQFIGLKTHLEKVKAVFPKIKNGEEVFLYKGIQNPNLSQEIIEIMGMTSLRTKTTLEAKHVYRALGYFEHDDTYLTFMYLDVVPKQENYSPFCSLHVQTINIKTMEAMTHQNWGNKINTEEEYLYLKDDKFLSYIEAGKIMFKKVTVFETTTFYFDPAKKDYFIIK